MRILLLLIVFLITNLFSKDNTATRFGAPLNTQNVEYSPVISPDGRYIVFQSNRPGGQGGMDFWLSENKNYRDRTGKPQWLEPVNLTEISTSHFEGPFTILFDEEGKPKELYFTSVAIAGVREGYKGQNIYYSKRESAIDKWSVPIHLNDLNSDFDDKMPSISPDGKKLIFSSNRPGGYGGFDLWISERVSELSDSKIKWSRPVNLGSKVNSSENEIMPYIHYDNLSLYFSSDRKDEYHKFHFYGIDFEEEFEKESITDKINPEHQPNKSLKLKELYKLPIPIHSSMDDEGISLTWDGIWIYFSSNRDGGEGQFDIYRTKVPDEMRKPYLFDFNGIVLDGSEEKMIGLASTIKIYNEKGLVNIITSQRIGGDLTVNNPKNFSTKLYTNSLYKIEVSAPEFHPTEFSLDLRGSIGANKSKYVKIILLPLDKEETLPSKEIPTKTTKDAIVKDTKPTETPKDVKDSKEAKEVKDTSKIAKDTKSIFVKLVDKETKKEIQVGTVKIFHEKEKNGLLLKKEKEGFLIETRPEKGFELYAQSKGYNDETLIINEGDFLKQTEFTIYLSKATSSNKIYSKIILFEFNEYELTKSHKKDLEPIINFLKSNLLDKVEIGGHTDNVAGKDFNLKLSMNRAVAIKEYLVSQGIDTNRLQVKAYWYSQPVAENDTEEGRAKNRRVSFKKIN
jgi:peptidoglycan-associated lipoprotein